MGTTVTLYFLHWIQDDAWIEKHISNLVNVGGTLLGVPKAMTAILSGEMRDTVDLPVALSSLVERLFSRKERAKLFRNWGGASSMYLKGGNAVWGDLESAPDDLPGATESYGPLLRFKNSTRANLTLDGSRNFLTDHTPLAFQNMLAANWSTGMERDSQQIERNQLPKNQRTWSNPLESRLPNAPSMKIYCIYGQGKETERAYHYVTENSEAFIDGGVSAAGEPVIRNGVLMGEGDGTVSLLSLGAMCVDGWKRSRYNPSKIPVVTYEIKACRLSRMSLPSLTDVLAARSDTVRPARRRQIWRPYRYSWEQGAYFRHSLNCGSWRREVRRESGRRVERRRWIGCGYGSYIFECGRLRRQDQMGSLTAID